MWVKWTPGMAIVNRRLRIAGTDGQYNLAQNFSDNQTYKLPAGLAGVVLSISPFKIEFNQAQNARVWGRISPHWGQAKMFAKIDVARLAGVEIEL